MSTLVISVIVIAAGLATLSINFIGLAQGAAALAVIAVGYLGWLLFWIDRLDGYDTD
jgi:hypothetical protein